MVFNFSTCDEDLFHVCLFQLCNRFVSLKTLPALSATFTYLLRPFFVDCISFAVSKKNKFSISSRSWISFGRNQDGATASLLCVCAHVPTRPVTNSIGSEEYFLD